MKLRTQLMIFKRLSRRIKYSILTWTMFAYVFLFIKLEKYRSKAENWTYKQDEKIKDRE